MKKLFLSASFADVSVLFSQFLDGECKGKTVTFIPTASLVEEVTFYVDAGKDALRQLGLIVEELEISTATQAEIVKKIAGNDCVYITGGNTFFLLQELRRTGADKIIAEHIDLGKPYVGESAGSIVASPDIEYIKQMDDLTAAPNLASFSSLGLVDFYPLPHYTNEPFKEVVDDIIVRYGQKRDLRPISNTQAILVDGNKSKVLSV